ncbi:hypothetical protein DFQ28_011546 [Apophysomyces sp. BC1034]|nr:hypothetical protein DFQ30_003814 [Apophysomyces sp. BC1015]KAG0178836.1 hypothetical protein DFQ29_002930 [Apophysomyces sp. BC1021]KAG0191570.1 hypothetical protein DFQ28_011546 [Apophysomyces sp. BC1034]
MLLDEHDRLLTEVTRLTNELQSAQARIAELETLNSQLQHQLTETPSNQAQNMIDIEDFADLDLTTHPTQGTHRTPYGQTPKGCNRYDQCRPERTQPSLNDPKYTDLPETERAQRAFEHHCDRMIVALKFLRPPVRSAVAHVFASNGWIPVEMLKKNLQARNDPISDILSLGQDSDSKMGDKHKSHGSFSSKIDEENLNL